MLKPKPEPKVLKRHGSGFSCYVPKRDNAEADLVYNIVVQDSLKLAGLPIIQIMQDFVHKQYSLPGSTT